jgi:6-phosphofructokinase 1
LLSMDVKASSPKKEIDFGELNWKERFQEDWEKRFRLPHITDILDIKPRHSTFSLKKSR